MGIDKFQSYLKNVYYCSILEKDQYPYDHVYIDLNFLLHKLISYSKTEDDLIQKTIELINNIIQTNRPLKTLNLMADGSASYAKIVLQRRRRLQMAFSIDSEKLNTMMLTAGTKFMNKFNEKIKQFSKQLNINVNLSLSDEPDESEIKISHQIRLNTKTLYDTHIIFSNDADIVVIAMSLDDIYGIYVSI